MNPIVEKVFATEESARKKVLEAKDKAQEIISNAAKEADAIIAKAKEESLEASRKMLDSAKAEEAARIDSERNKLSRNADNVDTSENDSIETAAGQIAGILLGTKKRED